MSKQDEGLLLTDEEIEDIRLRAIEGEPCSTPPEELKNIQLKAVAQAQLAKISQLFEKEKREILREIEGKARFVEATDNKVLLGAMGKANALLIAIQDWQALKSRLLKGE